MGSEEGEESKVQVMESEVAAQARADPQLHLDLDQGPHRPKVLSHLPQPIRYLKNYGYSS